MNRVIALFLSFLISACSVLAPAPTTTPTQTAALISTDTPAPIPTATQVNTPQPRAETPDPISVLLPSGNPEKEWNGIRIMPGAINGDGDNEGYRFTINATAEEVQAYYEKELGKLGWGLMAAGSGATDSVMLIFSNEASLVMSVSIFPHGDLKLVLIVSD